MFEHTDVDYQQRFLQGMSARAARDILLGMSPSDRGGQLEEVPSSVAGQFVLYLRRMDPQHTLGFLGYEESTVGRVMTPDLIDFPEGMTVAAALQRIRLQR